MMCSYTATIVYCDECGCELTVSEDKASSSEILRRHGWHITEKGEYCPECSKSIKDKIEYGRNILICPYCGSEIPIDNEHISPLDIDAGRVLLNDIIPLYTDVTCDTCKKIWRGNFWFAWEGTTDFVELR